jgi:Carboxypeptidase regulatory-like domain
MERRIVQGRGIRLQLMRRSLDSMKELRCHATTRRCRSEGVGQRVADRREILLLGHPKPVAAQGETSTLIGMVQDSTGQPIAGAQLYVLGTKYVGLSDSSGYFEINGRPHGALVLRARALGFRLHDEPVEGNRDRTTRVKIVLASVGGCLNWSAKGSGSYPHTRMR